MPSTNGRASRARRRALRIVQFFALAALLAACSGDQSVLDPKGPFAKGPDDLFMFVFWIAVVVFVLVQGLIVYTAVKFRQKAGDDALPVQTHGNTKLEIVWTVIPALILAAISVPTIQMIFDLDEEPPGAMTVEVIGHRWWWEYRYPDYGIITANELVIPVGVPIRLEMRAEESGAADRGVLHSYWVPKLGGKQDVIPGRMVTLNIQADTAGRYLGQCAEYCGLSHANMRNRAVALDMADFEEWVAAQQQPAAEPSDGLAVQGRELFTANCAACHTINSSSVAGADDFTNAIAPNLTHLMSRKEFAGAIFDLYGRDADGNFTDEPNVDLLKEWLRNPPAMKAMRPADGIGMPNLNLSEDQIEVLVAYLTTLQ